MLWLGGAFLFFSSEGPPLIFPPIRILFLPPCGSMSREVRSPFHFTKAPLEEKSVGTPSSPQAGPLIIREVLPGTQAVFPEFFATPPRRPLPVKKVDIEHPPPPR